MCVGGGGEGVRVGVMGRGFESGWVGERVRK